MSTASENTPTDTAENLSAEPRNPAGDTTSGPASGRRVVVVGGGITGLTAAFAMLRDEPGLQVQVLEASDHVGGQVRSMDVDGTPVDVGAEAIHLGSPDAARLVRELGLADTAVGGRPGTSLLLTRKGLRPLPAGVGPTGPTQVMPVLRSGILSPKGLVRAGLEPLHRRRYTSDMAVADFVQMRFGREVADTFVDPLLGNLHSGNVHTLSLQATAKQLVPVASGGSSLLMRALRPRPTAPGGAPASAGPRLPMFASWPGGLEVLVRALATSITAAGGQVRTGVAAESVERDGDHWRVGTSSGVLDADHVVVTTGPLTTAALLGRVSPATGVAMQWVRTASVATVVLGYDRTVAQGNEVLRDANGLLLTSQQAGVMKAMTNMTRKWPTLDDCPWHVLRLSVGRSTNEVAADLDDDSMIAACTRELGALINLDAAPGFARVARWPRTMPQLGVGHVNRMRAAREELAGIPGIHVGGGAADGLGLTSTITSGLRMAREVVG